MTPPTSLEPTVLGAAWAALTAGDEAAPPCPPLDVTGPSGHLRSRLLVEEVALASVGTALLAASSVLQQRRAPSPHVTLDRTHVAAAVRSERYFRRAGQPAGASFAPLSRFWRTADGWVRTHANYPWHRQALFQAINVDGSAPASGEEAAVAVADAMAARNADLIEARVFAAGGVAAAVRTLPEWLNHPQGRAVASEPLIGHQVAGAAPPRRRRPAGLPAEGVRVLDLTRVIAGPVCTRFLGALGAEVLRIDPPHLPDMSVGAVSDTLLGKRSAFLDLGSPSGTATLHHLLDEADVVVHGYRPRSLDRFGLGAVDLAVRHPGLVVVAIDAWGHRGPWSGRRGFDSIVQAASGIATSERADGGEPGALPCQLLDHGTGYLAAAAALDGLRRQAATGGTVVRSLSLARTAAWLTGFPTGSGSTTEGPAAGDPRSDAAVRPAWLVDIDGPGGAATAVAPPGALDGRPLAWPAIAGGYGEDAPAWGSR